ncbi:hypothetical protein U5817_00990 [Aromatoleum evansii]|uniref:Uncharacterized protein n=1 Tax=Aromatoleum evansii TaxID=59406 RepID=A0ABZ1ALA2_AROEV|nr:hypothetical protein U5817_00990 [Aromatoleum evansii]
MAKNVRTLVAIAAAPLFLAIGSAHAAKATPPAEDITFVTTACAYALDRAENAVRTQAYYSSANWTTNRDALLTKLMGIDLKLSENPPKAGDAMLIISDMQQKIEAWSDPTLAPNKRKLYPDGAIAIEATLTDAEGVAACIHEKFAY